MLADGSGSRPSRTRLAASLRWQATSASATSADTTRRQKARPDAPRLERASRMGQARPTQAARARAQPLQQALACDGLGETMVRAPLGASTRSTRFATPRTAANGTLRAAHAMATPCASRCSTSAPDPWAMRAAAASSTVIASVVASVHGRAPSAANASVSEASVSAAIVMGAGNWAVPARDAGSTRHNRAAAIASPTARPAPRKRRTCPRARRPGDRAARCVAAPAAAAGSPMPSGVRDDRDAAHGRCHRVAERDRERSELGIESRED